MKKQDLTKEQWDNFFDWVGEPYYINDDNSEKQRWINDITGELLSDDELLEKEYKNYLKEIK